MQQQILPLHSNLCLQIEQQQNPIVSNNSPNNELIIQQNRQSQRIYGQKGPGAPKGSKSQNKKNSVGGFVSFFFSIFKLIFNLIRLKKYINCVKIPQRRQNLICSNCKGNDTTLWRRNHKGEPVCK